VTLAVLLSVSCNDGDPTSPPPGSVATNLGFSLGPNGAQVDTWSSEVHEEHGFLAATVVNVRVQILDANGARITSATNAITIELDGNPGGGTLYSWGGTTLRAVDGVAAFELAIDEPGSGYTLRASAEGITSETSNAFTISE
jgi:hypothetical protein